MGHLKGSVGSPGAAVRHRINILGARELLGLQVAHRLALATAEGMALDPAAAAREVAGPYIDPAAAEVIASMALCAYKAQEPASGPPPAEHQKSVIAGDQGKRAHAA